MFKYVTFEETFFLSSPSAALARLSRSFKSLVKFSCLTGDRRLTAPGEPCPPPAPTATLAEFLLAFAASAMSLTTSFSGIGGVLRSFPIIIKWRVYGLRFRIPVPGLLLLGLRRVGTNTPAPVPLASPDSLMPATSLSAISSSLRRRSRCSSAKALRSRFVELPPGSERRTFFLAAISRGL